MDAAALLAVETRAAARSQLRTPAAADDGFADLLAREAPPEPTAQTRSETRDALQRDDATLEQGAAKQQISAEASPEIMVALLTQLNTAPVALPQSAAQTAIASALPTSAELAQVAPTPQAAPQALAGPTDSTPKIAAAPMQQSSSAQQLATSLPQLPIAPAQLVASGSPLPSETASALLGEVKPPPATNAAPATATSLPGPTAQAVAVAKPPTEQTKAPSQTATTTLSVTDAIPADETAVTTSPQTAATPQATAQAAATQTPMINADPRAGRAGATNATTSAKPRTDVAGEPQEVSKSTPAAARAANGHATSVKPAAANADTLAQPGAGAPAPGLAPIADAANAATGHTPPHTSEATSTSQSSSPASLLKAHTVANLAGQIVRKFDAGQTSFELRLDPAELGRVDIRLDVARDRRVHATISADSGMTLAELSRATKEIERALAEAGLDVGEDGIQFSLNDPSGQSFAQRDNRNHSASSENAGRQSAFTDLSAQPPPGARPLALSRWAGARLDVWA